MAITREPATINAGGPKAVQQGARGDLHGRVHRDLDDGEQRQRRRLDAKAVERLDAGHAQRRAVHDGHKVGGHGSAEHDPDVRMRLTAGRR